MPIVNGSFEDPGARPGVPNRWTITAFTSVEEVAAFGDPAVGFEDFGWATETDLLLGNPLLWEDALFDLVPVPWEDLEDGWNNDLYQRELTDGFAEQAIFDGEGYEDFEDGWNNDAPYERDFDSVPLAAWPINPEGWTIATYGRNFDTEAGALIKVFGDPTTPAAESFEDPSWPALATL